MTKISYDKLCKKWKTRGLETILTADADMFDECVLQIPMAFFSSF